MTEPSWRPAVADVAALLWARTKIDGGEQIGTFQDEDLEADPPLAATRPDATTVEALIDQAVRRVGSALPVEICAEAVDLEDDAGTMAATYAAMLVEQSYYPEQTAAAGSSFQSLRSLFTDGMKVLTEAVGERCGAGDGSAVGGAGPIARFTFDSRELIGPAGPDW